MVKRKLSKPDEPKDNESAPLPTSEADVPEGLELWDYYCPVRTPVTDKKYVYIDKEVVSETFECPICLDVVKGTMVVTECMHRFCQECIEKTMRLGKKQCPTCRSQVPSRRALRSDKTFDEIAEILFLKGNFFAESDTNPNGGGGDDDDDDEAAVVAVGEMRDTDGFSNAMDYRRRKTAKWDTLEEREQEKLDEETRKIVEKYQKSDFAKMVARGLKKQRAIIEAQDKEFNGLFPDSQFPEDDPSAAAGYEDDGGDFEGGLSQRGRRGRRRGRRPSLESMTSSMTQSVTSPSSASERGRRGAARGRRGGARGRYGNLGESVTSSNDFAATPTSSMTSPARTQTSAMTSSSLSMSTNTNNNNNNTTGTANHQKVPVRNLAPGINIVLEPFMVNPLRDPYLNQMYPLDRKYFMISGDATVGVVAKYLAGRFGVPDRQVGLAIESSVDVPVNDDVPKVGSIPGYKTVNPKMTLLELNVLRKKRNLLASSTLFFKYFYYYIPNEMH